ncbi:MAG: hypothetical protein ACYC61_30385, partial [Isosphaeraceae bacterium]
MLIELIIAAGLLAVILSLTVKVLGQVGQQRRAAERRQRALVEASNAMERITARPYDEITPRSAAAVKLSPDAAAAVPGAELNVDVRDEPASGVSSRRVAVRLRWKDSAGQWEAPVHLVTWVEPSPGRRSP